MIADVASQHQLISEEFQAERFVFPRCDGMRWPTFPPIFALHKPRLSLASEITSSKGPTAETEVGSAVIHVFLPSLCLYSFIFPFEAISWLIMTLV